MRHLLLFFLVAFGTTLAAQCSISVELAGVECVAGGDSLILSFDVEGTGEVGWVAPLLGAEGGYDTDEIFVATIAVQNGGLDSIGFFDILDGNCVTYLTAPEVDCGFDGNCNLIVTSAIANEEECGGLTRWSFSLFNGRGTPPFTYYLSTANGDTLQTGPFSFDATFGGADLGVGAYVFEISDANGCSAASDFFVQTIFCGVISGRTWFDEDGDGIRDSLETETVGATVTLTSPDFGGVVATSSSSDGTYAFGSLRQGQYTLSIEPITENQLTLANQGDDDTVDSDFDPVSGTVTSVVVGPDEVVTNVDAGFLDQPLDCGNFRLDATTIDTGQDCSTGQVLIVEVIDGTLPVELSVIDRQTGAILAEAVVDQLADTITLSNLENGSYRLRGVDANGCVSVRTIAVESNPGLTVGFDLTAPSCLNDLSATATPVMPLAQGPFVYSWSTGETTATINVFQNVFLYTVTVTDLATGCSGVGQLFGSDIPEGDSVERFSGEFRIACDEDSVLVSVDTILPDYTYQWIAGNSGDTIFGPSFYATRSGNYFLFAFNGTDCPLNGVASVADARLGDQFYFEPFSYQDSICGATACIGVESSIPFWWFQDSTIQLRWEGPDQELIDQINGFGIESQLFFCTDVAGLYRLTLTTSCDTLRRDILVDTPESCSRISGALYIDLDGNCALDPGESVVPNYIITLTNQATGEMYYEMTDANGNWSASLPFGEYVVVPTISPGAPFEACDLPDPIVLGSSAVTGVRVFLRATTTCAQMSTTVTMPFLRRCFSGLAWVEYENRGSVTAVDAQLTVVLDDFFNDITSDRAATTVNGREYTFNLGDVPPFSSGRIRFNFTISCESTLGQSHCIEASVKPDTPCSDSEAWNGALVRVDALGCEGDSVRFLVTNIGDEQMSVPLSYVIVEDGIMLSPTPFVNGLLLPGEAMPIAVPSTGGTFHLTTNQEPNAPAEDEPTAVIEGCRSQGGDFSTGFTNLLPLHPGPTTSSVVCRANVGSYDPNDKRGFPLGFGNEGNSIKKGTRLDYNIRFQNTGTDTAFTVIISDTIAKSLDLATIKFGAASHPYTVKLDTHRVLTFTFANILLPDSTTNLAASQGVVTFSIDHDESLILGSSINNEAAIYFDFNEPIITNLSRHVLSKEGLPVSTRRVEASQIAVAVFPNPASTVLTINVPSTDLGGADRVKVTDLYGRVLINEAYTTASDGLDVRALPAGYYLAVITSASGVAKGRAGFVVVR